MQFKTVAGPFKTREQAESTAKALGYAYTAYGVHLSDDEGFVTEEQVFYVEHNHTLVNDKIFGYDAKEFLARQYKKS